jgi:hypothetical protein
MFAAVFAIVGLLPRVFGGVPHWSVGVAAALPLGRTGCPARPARSPSAAAVSSRSPKETDVPHSLGCSTRRSPCYTGFKVNFGEYKVSELAPYGEPKHVQLIYDPLLDFRPDEIFRLKLECFDCCTGLTMTNARFDELFGGPPRKVDWLTQRGIDLAIPIQAVMEEVVLRLTRLVPRPDGARSPGAWGRWLAKDLQDPSLKKHCKSAFELD